MASVWPHLRSQGFSVILGVFGVVPRFHRAYGEDEKISSLIADKKEGQERGGEWGGGYRPRYEGLAVKAIRG